MTDEPPTGALGRAVPRRAPGALLPDARLGPGRRGRAAGCADQRVARAAALRGPQLAALVALQDRDQRLPQADRAPAQARAADRLRPAGRPARRARRAAGRVGVGRALPRRAARARRRRRRARGALRAARERRARVHRGAPAPAAAPARGADPARRARLLGRRGRRRARHDAGLRLQRAPARARRRSTSACPSRASRRRWRRSATSGCARWSSATSTPGRAATSTRSSRCSPRTPRSRCRRGRPGTAAATRCAAFLREFPLAGDVRSRLVPAAINAQLAFGHYFWDADQQAFVPHGVNLLTLRGDRIADITTFLTPAAFDRLELPALAFAGH